MLIKEREEFDIQQLNQMQRYLGEETIEDYQAGLMSRRRMLRRLIYICGSASAAATLLAACGDTPTATPTTQAAPPTTVATTAAPTTAAATTAAPTTAAPTTAVATTAAPTTAATTASGTTAPATTAPPAATPGPARGPLIVPENDPAVEASEVSFQSDTEIKGYLAKPKAAGTYPGVIVIHENRGLTDHIKDVARRLAKAGYIALAPDLVSRSGGTPNNAFDKISGILGGAKPEDLVKDLRAGIGYLEKVPGLNAGKIGVVGFCLGGAYTLRLAAAEPKVLAAVPYYGPAPEPISQMANTKAAILGQYGGNDARVNGTIPQLEKTLKDAGKTFEQKVYAGANHAFNNDTGASFNEQAAVQAWGETLAWFKKYLS